jgi:hypothetical protein
MKQYVVYLTLLASLPALAQFTVSPFGAAGPSAPPNGDGDNSECGPGKSCSLEVTIRPFCFGTNLRSYPVDVQMDPTKKIFANLAVTSSEDAGKGDNFVIGFPGQLTFDASGSHVNCSFAEGQDPATAGNKQMRCFIPWLEKSFDYTLGEWKSRVNPYTNHAHPAWSGDFVKYSGIGMPAKLNAGQGKDIDEEVTCLYRFTKYNFNGVVIPNSVNCYFPSRLPDLSSQVSVTKDGAPANVTVTAYVNSVKIRFKGKINALPETRPFKHGKMVLEKAPNYALSFSQPGTATTSAFFNPYVPTENGDDGSRRTILHVSEGEEFDANNGYQSFTAQVKFPGMEGFCGGFYSPLMLFFGDKLPKFNGVSAFRLFKIPEGTPVHWPERNAPGYFLARLQAGETAIASYKQLFGQDESFGNGFEALKAHDDDKDGVISAKDKIWAELYLWNDANGDGFSQPDELKRPKALGLESVSLAYTTKDESKFGQRAIAREKGTFTFKKKGKRATGNVYDMWFAPYKQQ